MLEFKERYVKLADKYYDDALIHVYYANQIEILTYVPMKPKDIERGRFNRFQSLNLKKITGLGVCLKNILRCEKNFSQKHNDMIHRKENVKNAYTLLEDVNGKNVAVIDDLYSTGSTINEIARVLYENGAKSVSAVFLAVNQMTESPMYPYKHIKCDECGHDMILKINKRDYVFFGCSNFPNCNNTLSRDEGLKNLKQINQISVEDTFDLEDVY